MAKCEVTGKKRSVGNNVSHANNKTRRTYLPNVQKVKIMEADGTVRRAKVSTKALKSGAVSKAAPRKVLLELAKADQAAS